MGGDALELHEQDADLAGPAGHVPLDPEQPLHCQAVSDLLEERGDVVHARHVGDALGPRPVLHVLLDAGVQEARGAADLADVFAVKLEEEAVDAVRRRVDGAEVDDNALLGHARRLVGDFVPIPSDGGEVRQAVELGLRGSGGGVDLRVAHQL